MDDTMIVSTLRSHIESLLRATKRDGVEDLLRYMNRRGFFTKPCGEHHPMKGGLAWHSLEVLFGVIKENEYDIPLSSIVIVSLLHEANLLAKDSPECLAGSTAVTVIQEKGHFKLLRAEEEAILLQKYSTYEVGRIFRRPSFAVGSPLRSLLRFANDISIEEPKSWEELTDLMNGKIKFPQLKEDEWRAHNLKYFFFEKWFKAEKHYAEFMKLTQKPKPSSVEQIEKTLKRLEEYGLDMHQFYEILDARYNRHQYPFHRKGVSESHKQEMDGILRDLCYKRRVSADELATFLYGRENKHIFDHNYKVAQVCRELQSYFGLRLETNTMQGAVRRVLEYDK